MVIDDYSSYVWLYPILIKSDAADLLVKLITQLRTEFGNSFPVVTLHTDDGGEFRSAVLKDKLVEYGIKHDVSLAYEHAHNGKVERANRTIETMTRAIMVQANSSQFLWPEAVKSVGYILNRVLVVNELKQVPIQVLYPQQKIVDLSRLRVWGCDAFVNEGVHVVRPVFSPNAKRHIFVGYVEPSGYRFILPSDPTVVVTSRNVVFNENSFEAMNELKAQVFGTELGNLEYQRDFNIEFESTLHRNEARLQRMMERERQGIFEEEN